MVRLPGLTKTSSSVPMIRYTRLLWSNFCIYVFMLLFSLSIFSDWWSLKIENEKKKQHKNSDRRNLIYGTRVPRVQVYKETNLSWLELPLTQTNVHGPKPV